MKYVFFLPNSDYDEIIYAPLRKRSDVFFCGSNYIQIKPLKILNKLHTSYITNRKIRLPFQSIWYSLYLRNANLRFDEEVCFIFIELSKLGYEFQFLKYLRKKYQKAHFIFRCENITKNISCVFLPRYNNVDTLIKIEENYDYIISFDKKDVNSHSKKWHYYPSSYNGKFFLDSELSNIKESDLLFLGLEKGRLKTLVEIYDKASAKGISCLFFVAKAKTKIYRDGIIYIDSYMPYEQYLKYLQKTNCLLEILESGQVGHSLRFGEAIFYGKKLISNAEVLSDDHCSMQKCISSFSSSDDFDYAFAKDRNCVEYQNKESISIDNFLDFINTLCI